MKKLFFAGLALTLLLTGAGCISFGSSAPGPMGMFRSTDKGNTWNQANTLVTASGLKSLAGVQVFRLFTDPNDPNALYMATRGQGLFYSYDNGSSWQSAAALAGRFIYSVAVDPGDKCTIYATDGQYIFKTSDCSRSWHTIHSENPDQIQSVAVDFGSHSTLYAALFGGQIIRSLDGGNSWQVTATLGSGLRYLAADPLTPGRVYVAGGTTGLWRSDNSGLDWKNLTSGIQNFNDATTFYRLILHPAERDTLYWLSKYGILYSNDAGNTWKDMKLLSAPGSVNIYSFAINPQNPNEIYYVGTVILSSDSSRSTFYRSTDGGSDWTTKQMPTNAVPVTMIVKPDDPSVLFMGFTKLNS